MLPYIGSVRTYFLMWGVAAGVAIPVAVRLAVRGGFPWRRALPAVTVLALALIIGSKLLFLIEAKVFPSDDPFPAPQGQLWGLVSHGFRNPGGIILLIGSLPLVSTAMGLPTLSFADAVIPAVGLAIVWFRLGCFSNGCCFGAIRPDSFFAMRFPPLSRVFQWQVKQGLLTELGPSLPVIPLELFYAALGGVLFIAGIRWQKRGLPPGEILARFSAGYFGGEAILETFQAPPYRLNAWVCGGAFVVTIVLWIVLRSGESRVWSH